MRTILLLSLTASLCFGQLKGVVDIHVHTDPDSMARKIDILEVARLAKEEGMRAMVIKNHYESTAQQAYLISKLFPGLEVYSALVLNRSVGGLNPEAIAHALGTKGNSLKIVWMPTFDSENGVRFNKEKRPFVPVAKNGKLVPEVIEILRILAKENVALATGHSSAAEDMLLVREAHKLGVARIVVKHPLFNVVTMSMAQMKEAAGLGAFLELCANQVLPTVPAATAIKIESYAEAIKAIGAEHFILSSDLGQPHHPVHTEGWKIFLASLKKQGITDAQIDLMARRNPAQLLGLK